MPPSVDPLHGLVAVITGSGRGIGRALALALAEAGAKVVVSARTAREIDTVVSEIVGRGGEAMAVVADATDREEAIRPVERAIEVFGRIDVLVNNVGGSPPGNHDPYTGDLDVIEATLVLNLTTAFWTTSAALPHMRAQSYGRIISIGSGASNRASASWAYTTAKHDIVGFTKQLAQRTGRDGITVNCLCPGWTNTSLVNFERIATRTGSTADAAREDAEAQNAQGRILEPEELGPLAVLLASPAGASMTGQVIGVDGGYRL
jgi:NAD(P)-dependent dehydrogenase (short-subunit alcohol dehydrogenase family)